MNYILYFICCKQYFTIIANTYSFQSKLKGLLILLLSFRIEIYLKMFLFVFFMTQNIVQQKISMVFKSAIDKKSIFKNKRVLDISYIPDNILHRDSELYEISKILSVSLKNERPSNVFVYGPTGTGKTLVVDYVCNELLSVARENKLSVHYVYVNAKLKRIADTEYRLVSHIANELGEHIPFTGLPTDVVYSRFLNKVESLNGVLIIVIDEIDYLVNKIGDRFLYTLTRINQDLYNTKVSIIGISNNLNFTEYLDARVRSSLSEEEVVFSPYNAIQLRDILEDRSKKAFYEGVVENSVINKCAAIAAQENGDARKALDLLRVSAEIAERNNEYKVKEYHVDLAQKKIDYDRFIEVVKTLAQHQKLTLFAVLDLLLSKDVGFKVHTGDVYDKYVSLCNRIKKTPITQRRISDIINELDILGIINAKIKNLGRYGRTREVSLANSKDVYEKIYNLLKNDLYL